MIKCGIKSGMIRTLVLMAAAVWGLTASGATWEQDLPLLSPPCEFQTEGKVVVVGDVYADLSGFLRILASQDLIDHNNNWIAEDAHLVQMGNIFPSDSSAWNKLNNTKFEHEKVARYLMKLQTQARVQGGDVHSLQGMLETLIQRWRTESIPIGLCKVWAEPDSQQRADDLRERWLEDLKPKNAHFSPEDQARLRKNLINYIKAYHQPGAVEMLERYGKYDAENHRYVLDTEFAQWFRSRNVVIKINGVIYAHVGISPKLAGLDPQNPTPAMSLEQINDLLRERNSDPTLFLPVDADLDGPVWWRKMPLMDDGELRSLTSAILPMYDAKAIVVGHTLSDMITHRGDVFFVRSGLGSRSFRTKLNIFVIEGDHWTIIEERRAIEEGDFTPSEPEILEGGPADPIIPGGGVPKMKDSANRSIVGRWLDESPLTAGRITIFRENGKIFIEQRFKDGSVFKEELVENSSPLGRRFDMAEGSSFGDHWILSPDGTLHVRDNEGLIKTAKKIG